MALAVAFVIPSLGRPQPGPILLALAIFAIGGVIGLSARVAATTLTEGATLAA
jgi:hypothetical protein